MVPPASKDPYICSHCGERRVVPSLAAECCKDFKKEPDE